MARNCALLSLPGSFGFICVPQHHHKGTLDMNSQADLHVVS